MNRQKRLLWLAVMAGFVACGQAATLKLDTASRSAEGAYEATWVMNDFDGASRSVSIEFADVDRYVKAGLRPPGSLTSERFSVKSDGRQTKLNMRFFAKETQGKVGFLVDGQLLWVDLGAVTAPHKDVVSHKKAKAKDDESINASLKVVGVKVTGRPLVGETVGVDFKVLSTNKKDRIARSRIAWLSGAERRLVGTGKSYLVHEEDLNQPLFALITPISKSGLRGRSTEIALPQVIRSQENILPVSIDPVAVISPQRIWIIPVQSIVNGKSQVLTVTMNASEYLLQSDVESLVKASFSRGVNTQNLRELVQKIDGLYVEKKLSAFKALVPEQNFAEGGIQLTLMEPMVGNVSFSGQENENYLQMVSNRLGVRSGQYLRVGEVDEKVQIFNLRNRGKSRVLLEPGEQLGESDVHIEITPYAPPDGEQVENRDFHFFGDEG